jgi:hypothetical protein
MKYSRNKIFDDLLTIESFHLEAGANPTTSEFTISTPEL